MKRKIIFRVIALFAVFLVAFSFFPFSVLAADGSKMDVSEVCTDLGKLGIDITEYPKNVEADYCQVLHFVEYGYDYYGKTNDYALYIYVYNPSGKEILNYAKNFVQIQALSNMGKNEHGFRKLRLSLCSYSIQEGYEYVFYKFKVEGAVTLHSYLENGCRQYEISGIELVHKGKSIATDYKVGGIYTCLGYMEYHDQNKSKISSLKISVEDGRDLIQA